MSVWQRLLEARLGGVNRLPDDEEGRKRYPILWQFLTRGSDESIHKDVATISVKMGLGEWLIDLSDAGFAISCSATSPTLNGLLEALETVLSGPNPPIRAWKGEKGSVKQIPKKKNQGD